MRLDQRTQGRVGECLGQEVGAQADDDHGPLAARQRAHLAQHPGPRLGGEPFGQHLLELVDHDHPHVPVVGLGLGPGRDVVHTECRGGEAALGGARQQAGVQQGGLAAAGRADDRDHAQPVRTGERDDLFDQALHLRLAADVHARVLDP
ncbi:hypothetical protein GCM10023066_56340 [Nocardioides kongjuensis]